MLTNEEIKYTVWSYNLNKALGYDDFNLKFIKEMWEAVGDDILMFTHKLIYLRSISSFYQYKLGIIGS